ncbi:hypothetical protein A3A45_00880 [Candidatus Daviesbacteria bacterium RIFCSPLOWO2_01_FULL_36_8]|nr:MAG: hypothetical protein A3A45_00880 [Candidatus Daviesbacteria bacterium RIFCSPLOWO2_01_FULL_36_8]
MKQLFGVFLSRGEKYWKKYFARSRISATWATLMEKRDEVTARLAASGKPLAIQALKPGYELDAELATAYLVSAAKSGIYPVNLSDTLAAAGREIHFKAQIEPPSNVLRPPHPEESFIAEDHMYTGLIHLARAIVSHPIR